MSIKPKYFLIFFTTLILVFLLVQIGVVKQFIENTIFGYIETLIGGSITYDFEVTEPGNVIISLTWQDEFKHSNSSLHMVVYDSENNIIAKGRSSARPKIVVIDAKQPGTYKVRIRSYYGKSNYKLDILRPGEVIVANDTFFGQDSLWEIETSKLTNNEIEILWSEVNNKYANLEVEIYTSDMTLYGTYRYGLHPQKITLPDLPAGKYILRIRQLVSGHVNLHMNEAIRPIRVEDQC